MSDAITTSIRLSPRLRKALELRARREGRGKNWVISQALESFLDVSARDEVAAEARRQSLLASAGSGDDWTADADLGEWS